MKKPFKVVSITMVRNERDVIEPFVRHNLRFVDYMVVIDNNSTDDTRDILVKLARETGRVGVFDRMQSSFTQGEFLTRVMQAVQSVFFADFFVFLDGDEFIGAATADSFRKSIETIPQFGFGLMPWRTYVLPEGQDMDAMTANPPMSMKWCRVREGEQHYKVVLRTDGKILLDYQISNGNHTVLNDKGAKVPSVRLDEAPLLHFPVRSLDQLTVKCINGWMAVLAKQASGIVLGRNECHQWRENFERAMAGTLGSELSTASYFYSRPPGQVNWETDVVEVDHGIDCSRTYSDGRYGEVLRLVGKAWEASYDSDASVVPDGFKRNFLAVAREGRPVKGVVEKLDPALAARSYLDVPFLRWLYDHSSPALVLELGCGFGANLVAMRHFGAKGVAGLDDRQENETMLRGGALARRPVANFGGTASPVDLALCLGAVDGLTKEVALKVAAATARCATKNIAFLAAFGPGSSETGQAAMAQWLSVWRQLGWVPDMAATLAARACASLPKVRQSVLVLKPFADTDDDSAKEAMQDGATFLQWVARLPAERHAPVEKLFEEPFGPETAVYARSFRPPEKAKAS